MRVLFVGDAISGRLIPEEIKKVGVLVALAIADRDRTKANKFWYTHYRYKYNKPNVENR